MRSVEITEQELSTILAAVENLREAERTDRTIEAASRIAYSLERIGKRAYAVIERPEIAPEAFYFGYMSRGNGHCFFDARGGEQRPDRAKCPWDYGLMDTGLLNNGKNEDIPDGRVFWTCGGVPHLWFAFIWWDRSGDSRPNSNSGFYVRGFKIGEAEVAFRFACESFPQIVARQRHPLNLQQR